MNKLFLPNDASAFIESAAFPEGFAVTWAGDNPLEEGFCYGSESGKLAFIDRKGKFNPVDCQASAAKEAVNGVAWSKNWMAVTTRADITLMGPWGPMGPDPSAVHRAIQGGAHGVAVSPSGHFVLPLGRGGIMFIKPSSGTDDRIPLLTSMSTELNLCSAIALPGDCGDDLIVFAARRGGVGFTNLVQKVGEHSLRVAKFDELDIVDVCLIGTKAKPRAVAAAARDGSLILFNDIVGDATPQTVKFKTVTGTVYRVLSVRGDIFVLTSEGLFALIDVAKKFLEAAIVGTFDVEVLAFQIEAADANLVGDKWLLAAGIDEVFKLDLQKMPRSPDDAIRNGRHETPDEIDAQPIWEEREDSRSEQGELVHAG